MPTPGTDQPESKAEDTSRKEGSVSADSASSDNNLVQRPAESTAGLSETGGPKGPEPTRYGDWERKGRCIDF